jgi:hypothetical protein
MDYLKIILANMLELYGYKNFTQITKNIYLGNYKSSYNSNKQFDVIINCTDSLPFHSKRTINHRLNIKDDLSFKSTLKFAKKNNAILALIRKYDTQDKQILIHCHVGMQRSAAVIASYLIKYYNLSATNSITKIRKLHPQAFLTGSNFNTALYMIEHNIAYAKSGNQ